MSRLVIALLLSFCLHAIGFGLVELMVALPKTSGSAISTNAGLKVSLGTHRPAIQTSVTPASNRVAPQAEHAKNIFPDFWPELFIPIIEEDDGFESYLPSGDVDRRPVPESTVVVPFPKDGVLYSEKGEVVLQLYIGANGHIDFIKVESANVSLPFQESAINAFQSATMIPGIKNGEAVKVKMRIVVEFEEHSYN